jgi:hypothetical protein
VQTVFEGFNVNTASKAKSSADQYGLKIPVGHDEGPDAKRSYLMGRYRSGGTPWVAIIDRQGVVRFDGFHIAPKRSIALVDRLLAATP